MTLHPVTVDGNVHANVLLVIMKLDALAAVIRAVIACLIRTQIIR